MQQRNYLFYHHWPFIQQSRNHLWEFTTKKICYREISRTENKSQIVKQVLFWIHLTKLWAGVYFRNTYSRIWVLVNAIASRLTQLSNWISNFNISISKALYINLWANTSHRQNYEQNQTLRISSNFSFFQLKYQILPCGY